MPVLEDLLTSWVGGGRLKVAFIGPTPVVLSGPVAEDLYWVNVHANNGPPRVALSSSSSSTTVGSMPVGV